VITPSTDERWVMSLLALAQRGVKVAAVLLEASTFGGKESALQIVSSLAAADVWTYLVKQGDNLSNALAPTREAIEADRTRPTN
jgi:hypothetical protein